MRRKPNPANNFTLSTTRAGRVIPATFAMNNFNICGRVVNVGRKRADRAPWPVEIETEIGRDKTVIVPVEIFRPEPPPIGWIAVLSGVLDSREWQGRRYLQLVVKSHEFLPPPAPAQPPQYRQPPPPMPPEHYPPEDDDIPF